MIVRVLADGTRNNAFDLYYTKRQLRAIIAEFERSGPYTEACEFPVKADLHVHRDLNSIATELVKHCLVLKRVCSCGAIQNHEGIWEKK